MLASCLIFASALEEAAAQVFVGSPVVVVVVVVLLLLKSGRDETTACDINELLDHTTSRISTKGKYLELETV